MFWKKKPKLIISFRKQSFNMKKGETLWDTSWNEITDQHYFNLIKAACDEHKCWLDSFKHEYGEIKIIILATEWHRIIDLRNNIPELPHIRELYIK